jgi:hypothetical protein
LNASIRFQLNTHAARLDVTATNDSIPVQFASLILQAEAKYGQHVVVLVDEYDKPILDNLTQPDLAREMRDGLRNFYSVIKDQDAHIKFAFLLDIVLEDVSNFGKLDMAVNFNGQVYLFEFKVVEGGAEGKALGQIKEKKYADKYLSQNQPVHLIGMEFSKDRRNVVGFEVENLGKYSCGFIDVGFLFAAQRR